MKDNISKRFVHVDHRSHYLFNHTCVQLHLNDGKTVLGNYKVFYVRGPARYYILIP
jgi:hypothetical protein